MEKDTWEADVVSSVSDERPGERSVIILGWSAVPLKKS